MHVVSGQVLEQWATLTDEQVVGHVLTGQTAVFEILMRRYNEGLYRVARAIVRDDSQTEDVLQQAYLNAYANLRQFAGKARFSTWLTRIAVNESLARARRRGQYEPYDEDVSNVEPFMAEQSLHDPERHAFSGELRTLLEWAIDRLPDGTREVFVLREVEGLSTAEVADALGVSEDVVKTRLSRAKSALRRAVMERTGAVSPEVFRFHRPRCDRVVAGVLAVIGAIH